MDITKNILIISCTLMILTPKITSAHNATKNKISMNFALPADITSSVRDNKPATYSTPPATKLTRDMKSPTEIQRNDYASQPQLDINAFKMAQELAPETTRY